MTDTSTSSKSTSVSLKATRQPLSNSGTTDAAQTSNRVTDVAMTTKIGNKPVTAPRSLVRRRTFSCATGPAVPGVPGPELRRRKLRQVMSRHPPSSPTRIPVECLCAFRGQEATELSCSSRQQLHALHATGGWLMVDDLHGGRGYVPLDYCALSVAPRQRVPQPKGGEASTQRGSARGVSAAAHLDAIMAGRRVPPSHPVPASAKATVQGPATRGVQPLSSRGREAVAQVRRLVQRVGSNAGECAVHHATAVRVVPDVGTTVGVKGENRTAGVKGETKGQLVVKEAPSCPTGAVRKATSTIADRRVGSTEEGTPSVHVRRLGRALPNLSLDAAPCHDHHTAGVDGNSLRQEQAVINTRKSCRSSSADRSVKPDYHSNLSVPSVTRKPTSPLSPNQITAPNLPWPILKSNPCTSTAASLPVLPPSAPLSSDPSQIRLLATLPPSETDDSDYESYSSVNDGLDSPPSPAPRTARRRTVRFSEEITYHITDSTTADLPDKTKEEELWCVDSDPTLNSTSSSNSVRLDSEASRSGADMPMPTGPPPPANTTELFKCPEALVTDGHKSLPKNFGRKVGNYIRSLSDDGQITRSNSDACLADDAEEGILPAEPSATNPRFLCVLYDFTARESGDLSVTQGDILRLLNTFGKQWCYVQKFSGEDGLVPRSCVVSYTGDDVIV